MVICIDGHCFEVVVIDIWPPRPGPGPINYPQFLYDASLVASVQKASEKAADDNVRAALSDGVARAIGAMSQRAGEGIDILDDYPER